MYDPLAHYYAEIFPVSENQVQFVLSSLRNAGAARPKRQGDGGAAGGARPSTQGGGGAAATGAPLRLLDVGCAVGDLAAAVSRAGASDFGIDTVRSTGSAAGRVAREGSHSTDRDTSQAASAPGIEVDAIDLNSAMIQRAAARHSETVRTGRLRFHRMDMLKIAQEFEPESFDAVACLGNTLVHQPGPVEIEQFLKATARILRTSGTLILQLLNYNYLLRERPKKLPLIETEQIRFEREYSYITGTGTDSKDIRVVFTTRLQVKSTGEVHEDSIELYPLRRSELETLLESAGFGRFKFYGGFDGSPLELDSLPLIVVSKPQP